MATASTKESGGMSRDLRAEARRLTVEQTVLPGAIAREVGMESAALDSWLAERSQLDGAVVERLAMFLDDRALIRHAMSEASNSVRREFAEKLICNLSILGREMETADGSARADIRDQITMYLADLRRVIELMATDAGKLPERLAAALHSLLEPGDRLLISRSGNKAGARMAE